MSDTWSRMQRQQSMLYSSIGNIYSAASSTRSRRPSWSDAKVYIG